jgi:hypothetical protein
LFPESQKNKRLSTGLDRAGSSFTMAALYWFSRFKRLSSLPVAIRAPLGRPAVGYGMPVLNSKARAVEHGEVEVVVKQIQRARDEARQRFRHCLPLIDSPFSKESVLPRLIVELELA